MKTALSPRSPVDQTTDLLVVPVAGALKTSLPTRLLDEALGGRLIAEARRVGFGGEETKQFLFQTHGAIPPRSVLLIAADEPFSLYRLADTLAQAVKILRATTAAVVVPDGDVAGAVATVTEGATLARYEFRRFRSRPRLETPLTLTLLVPAPSAELKGVVRRAEIHAAAACYARDLANTPAGALTPRVLAAEARRLAGNGLAVQIHDRRAIRRLKMGALLGVAQGSSEPPFLIELNYRPPHKTRRRLALVGKGITFDSGGLSLKPADSMQSQKRDMAGGAVVLAVMGALRELRPAIEVHGLVPVAENMPGPAAIRPGDVLRCCNGKTIEVLNTDAEGRLILADALAHAAARRPDAIIDFATLTGAVRVALGTRYAAIMGTDPTLVRALLDAAARADEKLWELPLAAEYRPDIDSRVADLKNTGEGYAGTIIGGLFLREFVGDVPWAHIDFSSTVMSDGYPCHPKGASGYAVRTALRYIEGLESQAS